MFLSERKFKSFDSQVKIMALIKIVLILPFCLFAIFQLVGCDEHVKKRKDAQRQGKSKFLIDNYKNILKCILV